MLLVLLLAGSFVYYRIALTKTDASSSPTPANRDDPTPPGWANVSVTAGNSNCGFYTIKDGSIVVAASQSGEEASLIMNETRGFIDCLTTYYQSEPDVTGFTAYEVALVTIVSKPNVTFSLETGQVSLSPQQVANGDNNTIWTDFDPATVTTNSNGIAHSNFTIAGAFVLLNPVPPSNESGVSRLPILALSQGGLEANASLPIDFDGLVEGSLEPVYIFSSPGPVIFPVTGVMAAQGELEYWYGIVYAPTALETKAMPLQVTLSVAGSWDSGGIGPMPQGVQVSFIPQSFDLKPNTVFFFWVSANNTLAPTAPPETANYTLAVRETFGNSTYLEPLAISIWLSPPMRECCITGSLVPSALIVDAPYLIAASIAFVIVMPNLVQQEIKKDARGLFVVTTR
jgi:hypothetical protein